MILKVYIFKYFSEKNKSYKFSLIFSKVDLIFSSFDNSTCLGVPEIFNSSCFFAPAIVIPFSLIK